MASFKKLLCLGVLVLLLLAAGAAAQDEETSSEPQVQASNVQAGSADEVEVRSAVDRLSEAVQGLEALEDNKNTGETEVDPSTLTEDGAVEDSTLSEEPALEETKESEEGGKGAAVNTGETTVDASTLTEDSAVEDSTAAVSAEGGEEIAERGEEAAMNGEGVVDAARTESNESGEAGDGDAARRLRQAIPSQTIHSQTIPNFSQAAPSSQPQATQAAKEQSGSSLKSVPEMLADIRTLTKSLSAVPTEAHTPLFEDEVRDFYRQTHSVRLAAQQIYNEQQKQQSGQT